MNRDTHILRDLAALTEQERGEWIAEHEETRARLLALFSQETFTPRDPVQAQRELREKFAAHPTIPGAPGSPPRRGSFDALGRPRF